MREFPGKKNILWDFDGVILDSMDIRTTGFKEVLQNYPGAQVDQLIQYHKNNGGLSRYVKFRYFLKEIRKEKNCDGLVQELSRNYSRIMRRNLGSKNRLIPEVHEYIVANYQDYRMHIVSGSDGEELRYLCEKLDLLKFFVSIEGSPTPKIKLVSNILRKYHYQEQETCLIGDSVNDLEAAEENGIQFFGYNSTQLRQKTKYYIQKFR